MTTGAGTGWPVASTVTVGLPLISVLDRLVAAPPGRNSLTVPVTSTLSPTATVGWELVKTNTPSLVAGLLSGFGSWNQKPLVLTAVTMPGTDVTCCPTSGERCAAPWMSWMNALVGGGGGGPPLPVELRGFGVPAVKSTELLSVSVPASERRSAVVFERPGAGLVSELLAAPYPMKSRTLGADAQDEPQPSAVLTVTSATFPLVALMAMEPV